MLLPIALCALADDGSCKFGKLEAVATLCSTPFRAFSIYTISDVYREWFDGFLEPECGVLVCGDSS
jgi:hypothetical protein